jgi:DNA replication protein DnaC
MSTTDDLVPVLKKLRLSGVLQTLELRNRQAVEGNLPLEEFLYLLLHDEVERRDGKLLQGRLKKANFDRSRTLEDFDFQFNPNVPKSQVIDLATCNFVPRKEVIFFVGPSGTGKTHLSEALGHRACMAGYTVLYVTADQMFKQLRAARADQSYDRRLLRFTAPDLLIIDDVGLRPLRDHEPEDLYEIIRQRYEKGAMILTSNRNVVELYPLFGDPLLATAAMDRLLHHAEIIVLPGDSYRNPPLQKRKNAQLASQV